jgi:hypothetical protein
LNEKYERLGTPLEDYELTRRDHQRQRSLQRSGNTPGTRRPRCHRCPTMSSRRLRRCCRSRHQTRRSCTGRSWSLPSVPRAQSQLVLPARTPVRAARVADGMRAWRGPDGVGAAWTRPAPGPAGSVLSSSSGAPTSGRTDPGPHRMQAPRERGTRCWPFRRLPPRLHR